MQLSKYGIVFFIFLVGNKLFANMAPLRFEPVTNYYFANVDSFPDYKFYLKNSSTAKEYKLKQDAVFVIYPSENSKQKNKLDVWAINKKTNKKTNEFSLYIKETYKPLLDNTAHVAISFYFDKKKELSYTTEWLTPDCYSKNKKSKEIVPLIYLNQPTSGNNVLVVVSFFALLSLTLIYFTGKFYQRKIYV